jgi:uncharacterized membrane protein YhaH (DUF805 family)
LKWDSCAAPPAQTSTVPIRFNKQADHIGLVIAHKCGYHASAAYRDERARPRVEFIAEYAVGERWGTFVSLILAYPEFAVIAKRGHDRNAPTWIAGIFIAGAVLLDLMVLLDLAGPLEKPNTLFYVILAPFGIMALILLVDFGFRRGTVGENRFGPDPLAAQ